MKLQQLLNWQERHDDGRRSKKIIRDDPLGNIVKRMEAIAVAQSVLGERCTVKEIWKWAEGGDSDVETLI